MKKSRIVIPALAMIAFSMAASITGAVAWFTATRTATVTSGAYAVVKTSSNLHHKCRLSEVGAGDEEETIGIDMTDGIEDRDLMDAGG